MTGTSIAGNTKDAEIGVVLEYLSNFWRIIEMPLSNYEINPMLTRSINLTVTDLIVAETFVTTDTRVYD